jgi:hydroxymethylglutaryl-CoA reductase
MIDTRLEEAALTGATITIKLCKENAFVCIKFEGKAYKATGKNLTKATDKVLEAFKNHEKNVRLLRKEKKNYRNSLLRDAFESE